MSALASDHANWRRAIIHLFFFLDARYQNIFNNVGFIILQGAAASELAPGRRENKKTGTA